jgi:LmbE family N-acetylglucosaminyl deacetylase
VHRVEHLGYAASGHGAILYPDPPDRRRFVRADTEEAAGRLAALLSQERADVLLSYDPNGGYGHRDHVKVHEVGKRAAELAGVATVLEATLPREVVERLVGLARVLRLPLPFDPTALGASTAPARPSPTGSTFGASLGRNRRRLPATARWCTGAAGSPRSCGCWSGSRHGCSGCSWVVSG